MGEKRRSKPTTLTPSPLSGGRRVLYWCGRSLQVLGLLLMWWVLLLFTGVASMGVLLWWGSAAAGVFYAGWACTMWARKGCEV
jgi:hypothetical protein